MSGVPTRDAAHDQLPPRIGPARAGGDSMTCSELCRRRCATTSGSRNERAGNPRVAKGYVDLTEDGGEVTDTGASFLTEFGAELISKSRSRRIFCRPCLDWSERRYHLAGLVGAEICRRCVELGWLVRERDTRAVRVTSAGRKGLRDTFGLSMSDGGRSFSNFMSYMTRESAPGTNAT
jgi:hypothetical protein